MIFRRFVAAALAAFLCAAPALLISGAPATAQFADQANVVTAAAGTANAQTGTVANVTSYNDVLNVLLKYTPGVSNNSDTTLTLNGLGTSPNFRKTTSGGLAALTGGELVNGVPTLIQYNGTYFVIMSASTASLPSLLPQGYLTPCQITVGSPVTGCAAGQLMPTGDVTAATALYYEPAFGFGMPVWNGSNFVNFTFSELTLTIPSSRLANTLYDVYVFSNAGVVTVAFGPAWSTSTIASGARGTGAGTAQIGLTQGVWTNSVSISAVNGASTYTIAANQGTVVATCWMDGTNGQVSFNRTFGSNRKWSCDNFYNQQPIQLQAGDATATWTYSTNTWRQSNNASGNNLKIVSGLPRAPTLFQFIQQIRSDVNLQGCVQQIGVGWNSTTASSGMSGQGGFSNSGATTLSAYSTMSATYLALPTIGVNQVNSLEIVPSAGGTCTYYGSSTGMMLRGAWNG